jgi:hypothetical protein
LSTTYENILALDTAEDFQVPEDLIFALNEAEDLAGEQTTVEMDAGTHLFLLEFSKITNTGGVNNPFVTIKWPGIQIPQAIANKLLEKSLKCSFTTDTGASEEHLLTFYERNPAGRGLDFSENPDSKEDFLRYTIELQCLNPVADTRKTPLPSLEDLAKGATVLIAAGLRLGTEPIRDLENALREAGTQQDWYPDHHCCEQDLSLNTHLGDGGAMSIGRV